MKFRLLCLFLILLLLLSGCQLGGPAETTGNSEASQDVGTGESSAEATDGETTGGEEPPTEEAVVLPQAYIDLEFGESGSVTDTKEHVRCEIADENKGNVVTEVLRFDGEEYEVPHFRITDSGGVLRLTYTEISNMLDLYELLVSGYTMEAFLVNFNETAASSSEQCMVSSTQSGGYNLTTYEGKYTASVHTDGAYRHAILSDSYSTQELTHLVAVYDQNSETVRLYVNGECVDEQDAPGMLALASGECYKTIVIGGDINSDGGTNIHCSSFALSDFKLYRTPLDGAQAVALYARAAAELTGTECDVRIIESDSELNESDALFASCLDSFVEDVYQPDTALENAPTVLEYASSDTATLSGKAVRPATAVFDTAVKGGALYAVTSDGTELGTMYDAVKALGKKVIPAFRFTEKAEGEALRDFINENRIADCFLICSDVELLAEVADATFAARPLLDCTGRAEIDADAMLLETSKGGVKTILLDADVLDPVTVTALRARAISVVAVLKADAGAGEIHNAVHNAVAGILTEDAEEVFDYYAAVKDRTLCQTPLIVAHRGDPESHPDNMLRSLISAAQSSATSIELDIWMTKDGHIVLNHDSVTTNFSERLTCTKSTRAELKALTYEGPNAQAGDEIAFLDEVFDVFSTEYTDKVLTIEVKDVREAVIDKTVALAKEYGMTGRIQIIGMNHKVSNYTYEAYGLSAQMNQSYIVKKTHPMLSMKVGVMESTYLHSACFTQHSQENDVFMQAALHRLVKYSTWTSKSTSETMKNYLCGAVEYTTNMPHALDDLYRYLTVTVAQDGTVKVTGVTYIGEEVDVTVDAELVILEGSGTFDGGRLTGSGVFAFRLKNTVSGQDYYLCTPATVR